MKMVALFFLIKTKNENLKRLIIINFCVCYHAGLLCCEGDQALALVAQRGHRVSILGDTQNPTGCGSEQFTAAGPALSMGWTKCSPEESPASAILWLSEPEAGYFSARTCFMSCAPPTDTSHGILQPETPTRTPEEGRRCWSPGPVHPGPWDTGYGHAGGVTLKHHSDIWKVSDFWGKSLGTLFSLQLCMVWVHQLSVLAFFPFLRKPTTKPTRVFFLTSSKQQPACCWKAERCGVTDTSSFVLTPLSSASLKGKWTENIFKDTNHHSLSDLRWERSSADKPHVKPETVSVFPRPDTLMETQPGKLPQHFWPCCWVYRTSLKLVPAMCMGDHRWLWAGLSDPSSCRAGNSTRLFLLFPTKSCPCCDELCGIPCKSPCSPGCLLAVIC